MRKFDALDRIKIYLHMYICYIYEDVCLYVSILLCIYKCVNNNS